MDLLTIDHLAVRYRARNASVEAADVERLNIAQGEILGLVGESGCGKSTLAKAITNLLPTNGYIESGSIKLKNIEISRLSPKEFKQLQWKEIAIIPQSAMNSLDPVYKIRDQIAEALKAHVNDNSSKINNRIDELMDLVGLKSARANEYPHEFSGGMRQRAMIAMALALNPALVIADEPTTALDVIMQDQILAKIMELHQKFGMSMLLITHDIAIVAEVCNRMAVMYAGNIMEFGHVKKIFKSPYHPYTIGLQRAFPSVKGRTEKLISIQGSPPSLYHPPKGCRFLERCPWAIESCGQPTRLNEVDQGHYSACHRLDLIEDFRREAIDPSIWQKTVLNKKVEKQTSHVKNSFQTDGQTVVAVQDLKKWFPLKKGIIASLISRGKQRFVKAVDGVTFELEQGKILGLAGESGCGKTTVGRLLTCLTGASSGQILYNGKDVTQFEKQDLYEFHKKAQIIFQDPYESLNPRRTVFDTIAEPLNIQRICRNKNERAARIRKVLSDVGLEAHNYYLPKFPHELSGGERQRVAIARALVLEPSFLIADEPVSMLDVSIRAGILLLLEKLTSRFKMSALYISHDLSTVRYLCHKTAIMYLGNIVEMGETQELFDNPLHPYTKALMAAVPVPEPEAAKEEYKIKGEPPDPVDMPRGCRFMPRCPYTFDRCHKEPQLDAYHKDHSVRCWLYTS